MANGSTYLTKSCKCPDHKWEIAEETTVKSGKHFGETKYLVWCQECKKQWYTFSKKNILKHNGE